MTNIAAEHRVLLVNVARSGRQAVDDDALYTATRQWWTVAESRTVPGPTAPEHALAVVDGIVVAAYTIDRWVQREDGRRAFTGTVAGPPVSGYVGADVRHYFPRGAANPLRYVGCAASSLAEGGRVTVPERPIRSLEDDVASIAASLAAEPLAHLMFGHRELFHTNLLSWFFEALPQAADEVFRRHIASGAEVERRVRREDHHLDLHMTWPGYERLVIENKVFSVYDNGQLLDYADLVHSWGGTARLVLLGTTAPAADPAWSGGTLTARCGYHEWHYLSYADLGDRIDTALAGAPDSYEVETMRRYAGIARSLHRLVDGTGVHSLDERLGLSEAMVDALGDARLVQALSKARIRHVAGIVGTALADAGATGRMKSAYTSGGPLVEWFTEVQAAGETGRVGWQVQAGTFRRALITEHLAGRTAESLKQRLAYAAEHPQWFDFSTVDEALGTSRTPTAPKTFSTNLGFNKYDPDFVYRYKRVPDLTVGQLVDAAVTVANTLGGG